MVGYLFCIPCNNASSFRRVFMGQLSQNLNGGLGQVSSPRPYNVRTPLDDNVEMTYICCMCGEHMTVLNEQQLLQAAVSWARQQPHRLPADVLRFLDIEAHYMMGAIVRIERDFNFSRRDLLRIQATIPEHVTLERLAAYQAWWDDYDVDGNNNNNNDTDDDDEEYENDDDDADNDDDNDDDDGPAPALARVCFSVAPDDKQFQAQKLAADELQVPVSRILALWPRIFPRRSYLTPEYMTQQEIIAKYHDVQQRLPTALSSVEGEQ